MNHDVITVSGVVHGATPGSEVEYYAAAPADRRTSFSGSGLPFASERQAFEDSPNHGKVMLDKDCAFSISICKPNSYYKADCNKLITPCLYISYTDKQGKPQLIRMDLDSKIPYRSLSYPAARTSPEFYRQSLPVRGQYDILLSSRYPANGKESADFWGLKPAM